ncbi:MAG: ABC transporter ATP-binding protein [Bacteroidota bacterium]|nr:ABC transporter ATP-binding protein [Bacteroidota bacterium]
MKQRILGASIMIEVRSVTFSYGECPVLTDVSFAVHRGDFAVLRGESGSGKSTLLRLMCKLETPTTGCVFYEGIPYDEIPPRLLRRKAALLQQSPVMVEETVRDNLLLSFRFARSKMKSIEDRELRALLTRARLDHALLLKHAGELSMGQKQRIAFLRLLLMDPEVFLLDEPVSGLDEESTDALIGWLVELNTLGKTVFLVSHTASGLIPPGARLFRLENGHVMEEK